MPEDLFQFIDNLFSKKTAIDSRTVFKENYMTIKFLSLYPGTFALANVANRLSCKIPYWATNCFLFHSIEKQRPPKMHYPKAEEASNNKNWPNDAIKKIAQKYCCSDEHSTQILNILKNKRPEILEDLGIEEGGKSAKKNRGVSKPRVKTRQSKTV